MLKGGEGRVGLRVSMVKLAVVIFGSLVNFVTCCWLGLAMSLEDEWLAKVYMSDQGDLQYIYM